MWKWIGILVELYPLLSQLIQDVESSSMTGDQKKQAVLQAVTQMCSVAGIDITPWQSLIADTIDVIVDVFNTLGIFKHKTQNVPGTVSK
ncbi:MAG: hypothetical protein QW478_09475 [Candidatus Micrarchaeaceae archaeon]